MKRCVTATCAAMGTPQPREHRMVIRWLGRAQTPRHRVTTRCPRVPRPFRPDPSWCGR